MKTYSFVKKAGKYSFNKQQAIVFQALKDVGEGTLEELAARADELGLKTRQTSTRIVQYYLVSLRKLGLVESDGSSDRKITVVVDDEDGE